MRTRCEECDKAVFDHGVNCIECGRLMCDDCHLLLYRTKPACKGCAVDFQQRGTDSMLFFELQLDLAGKFVGRC